MIPGSLHAFLGCLEPVRIVDVGANPIDGAPPYKPLLDEGRARLLGFEPNPEALARLNERKGPHETYLPHAVGDGRRHLLKVCRAPGMTSLLEPDPAVLNLFHGFPAWGEVMERVEVATVRLDDVAEARGCEYLKIDIQGGELLAFENAPEVLATTLAVHTEVEFLPMYHDQPLFSEVEQHLRAAGFMFHRFEPLVSRAVRPVSLGGDPYAGLGQVLWADAVFLRDLTRLDRLSDQQLLHLATVMFDCYRAYDVVVHLLAEHDRRTGTKLAERVLAAVTG